MPTSPPLLDQIAARRAAGRRVAVLVSGDPGLYSLAQNVVRRFGREHCEVVPAVSSVQVAFARLGLDWADARILSAHGRTPDNRGRRAWPGRQDRHPGRHEGGPALVGPMAAALEASHAAFLCREPDARRRAVPASSTAEQLAAIDAASLSIVLLIRRSLARMTTGTLYGIGVGPGDPEWITVKAVRILSTCRHVCVPQVGLAAESVALEIARCYLRPDAVVHEQSFPMTADASVLRQHWQQAAGEVYAILGRGEDCCFLTLGDALLYSTYIYLLRELQAIDPAVRVVTVPGVTAFSAAAALANFPWARASSWSRSCRPPTISASSPRHWIAAARWC